MDELYDLDLINLRRGEMSAAALRSPRAATSCRWTCRARSCRSGSGSRSRRSIATRRTRRGRLTFWLDGRQIVDIANQPMAPTPCIEWNACSIGEDLTPSTAVLYVDDCAVSRSRVGPNGIIAD